MIDLSRYLPGRFCTIMLVHLGAEGIVIEPRRATSARIRPTRSERGARYLAPNQKVDESILDALANVSNGKFGCASDSDYPWDPNPQS